MTLDDELGSMFLPSNLDILICNNNNRCRELAGEVISSDVEDGGMVLPYVIGPNDYHIYQDGTRIVYYFISMIILSNILTVFIEFFSLYLKKESI